MSTISSTRRAFAAAFPRSAELYRRAAGVLPGGIAHDSRHQDPFPVYVTRAEGAYKWSAEGHQLIDYGMGHGALILGHRHPEVEAAVVAALRRGTHFSSSHPVEIEWAELICELVPCAEMVRFTASGTEATHLAARLARAATGRRSIVRFNGHFHGWHDGATFGMREPFQVPASAGVDPGASWLPLPAEDFELVAATLERRDVAAVILEPGGASWGTMPIDPGFLRRLRELTTRTGTVLIFDEVITGFRLAPGGAQERYGVVPDLSTLAKIVAGGLPGGAVAGRSDILGTMTFTGDPDHDRFRRVAQYGTYNANPVSAAAGLAALRLIRDGSVHARIDQLGERLRAGLNQAIRAAGLPGAAYGEGSMFHVYVGAGFPLSDQAGGLVDDSPYRLLAGMRSLQDLRLGLLTAGVDLLRDGGFVSAAHTEADIDATVEAFAGVLSRIEIE